MGRLERIAGWIDAASRIGGRVAAVATLGIVLVTLAVVVLRYGFSVGFVWMQEMAVWLHGLVFMAGAAWALSQDAHVRVDIFYRGGSARYRAWVDLLGTVFLLLPVCGLIFWFSQDYVARSWAMQEASREAGGLPGLYLFKTLVPVFCVSMMLQGVAMILRSLLVLRGRGHD